MTADTPYHLASATKLFTSVTVMQLRRGSLIDLDAPMDAYLDDSLIQGLHVVDGVDHTGQISVRNLLAQTSGLGDYFAGSTRGRKSLEAELLAGQDRGLTLPDMLDLARAVGPEFPPGNDRAHYSDTNFQLLGAIVESVTGEPLTVTFERLIFRPLGLTETYVFGDGRPPSQPAVLWHKGKSLHIPKALASFTPDGGGVTTLRESLRFIRSLFSGELLTSDELALMTSRWNRIYFPFEYGTGIQRFRLPRFMSPSSTTPVLVGHAGSTGSFCFHDPERQAFVVGTTNQTDNPGRPYRTIVQMLNSLS